MRVSICFRWCAFGLLLFGVTASLFPVEMGKYRLLSVSNSEKMILVSQIPSKTKFVLDAATAKVTVDGKPAEFQTLQSYTVVRLKFERKKGTKNGIDIDGIATEIIVSVPENHPKPK